jgi:mRNA interferase MazF
MADGIRRGDIVLIPFPFTDLSGRKARPALVVSSDLDNEHSDDLILAAITSNVSHLFSNADLLLEDSADWFESSGLRTTSMLRASKIVTLAQPLIYSRIGRLEGEIMGRVDRALSVALGIYWL